MTSSAKSSAKRFEYHWESGKFKPLPQFTGLYALYIALTFVSPRLLHCGRTLQDQ
jgi:hypothetical protein